MNAWLAWSATLVTVVVPAAYEAALWLGRRRHPSRVARWTHAGLRVQWLETMGRTPGSELLAVQTLRNSVMSATMTASTAALGLMGTATLAATTLAGVRLEAARLDPRMVMQLVLMVQLFAALVCSAMSVRDYQHVGFVAALPAGSDERRRWQPLGQRTLRRAGLLYSAGLRHLLMIAPAVAAILHPLAGPPAAVLLVATLLAFDHVPRSAVSPEAHRSWTGGGLPPARG